MPLYVFPYRFSLTKHYLSVFIGYLTKRWWKYPSNTYGATKPEEEHLCGIKAKKCSFVPTDMFQSLRIGVVV